MKKFLFATFTILIAVFSLSAAKICARAETTVELEAYLPSSYLEYFELNKPLDVWTDGTEFVICETNRIIRFDGTTFTTFDLSAYSVSEVYKKDNFIIFLSSSRIYALNVSTGAVTEQTQLIAGSAFDICGDVLVTNPSSEIRYYYINTKNDEFSAEELQSRRVSLTFTPSVLTLTDSDELFYMHEGSLYKMTDRSTETIAQSIPNARSLGCGENKIFISFEDGIKVLDAKSGDELTFIPISGERKLSSPSHPRGVFYHDSYLFIADDNLDAILRMDVKLGSISNFYITTNYNAIDRISPDSKGVYATDSEIYILDSSLIKAVDRKTNAVREIPLTGLGNFKMIASNGESFLLSSGTNLILAKEKNGDLESQTISGNLSRFENVTALSTFENDYFILNNETVNNQQRAVIYKLSANGTLSQYSSIAGRGETLTCDVFGDVYAEIYSESDGKYYVYANDISASKHKLITTSSQKLIAISADYEGNLFCLTENNEIIKSTDGENETFTLKLSSNLPSNSVATGLAITQGGENAYLLFKGFILSVKLEALTYSTPQKIAVPDDFSMSFSENLNYVTLKDGAKLFEVSLDRFPNLGDYFDYESMSANSDTQSNYILITTVGRYSLIANDELCAIVRSEDTVSAEPQSENKNTLSYVVSDCNLYSYPLIKDFATNNSVSKNDALTVLKTFKFNDIDFALVKSGDKVGYIATGMLKNGIAANLTATTYTSHSLSKNTKAFYDKELTDSYTNLKKGDIVTVLENNDGVCKILYDGKVCFIKSDAVQQKSRQTVKNVVVISLAFIALFSSAIYVALRLLQRKSNKH